MPRWDWLPLQARPAPPMLKVYTAVAPRQGAVMTPTLLFACDLSAENRAAFAKDPWLYAPRWGGF